MKKYRNDEQKAIALQYAQESITRFLKHEYSYTELMKQAAKAQLQIAEIITLVDQNDMDKVVIEDIREFFFFAIRAFELLEPFNEDETGAF